MEILRSTLIFLYLFWIMHPTKCIETLTSVSCTESKNVTGIGPSLSISGLYNDLVFSWGCETVKYKGPSVSKSIPEFMAWTWIIDGRNDVCPFNWFFVVVKVWRMRSRNFCIILVFHQSNSPDSAGLGCGVQTGKPLKLATEERSCGSWSTINNIPHTTRQTIEIDNLLPVLQKHLPSRESRVTCV